MPFIPHTEEDIKAMLQEINIAEINNLFDEIPKKLPLATLNNVPNGLNELEITRLMQDRAAQVSTKKCFIGAGAYEHFIPAAVWDIVGRGEFYTAYTPYQAEASQGTLQLIYEYQTMMAHLMGVGVSNASLYDGATALAEAILMAVRIKGEAAKRILIPQTVNPNYRKVVQSLVSYQGIIIEEIPYDIDTGRVSLEYLAKNKYTDLAALIIPQPNFFGVLESVDELTDWAHQQQALAIALVNPLAMAILKEPGKWGATGADIVCGEGQPLGVPLASGGPYFGFLCCKKEFIRQLPGRIVGCTHDKQGRTGYTLTLQTREQHIRRAKATSNICTNQGLLVTAATIYLSLLGSEGLQRVAKTCHQNASRLQQLLKELPDISIKFNQPFFHEFVVDLGELSVVDVVNYLAKHGVQAGYVLSDYPELKNCLLICATETKTTEDLQLYGQLFKDAKIAHEQMKV